MIRKMRHSHSKVCFLAMVVVGLSLSAFLLGGCGGGGGDDHHHSHPVTPVPTKPPTPDPSKTAMDAWQGNWKGMGTFKGDIDGKKDGKPASMKLLAEMQVGSFKVAKGSGSGGEVGTITFTGNAKLFGVEGSKKEDMGYAAAIKGIFARLYGKETADGKLEVMEVQLEQQGTITISQPGKAPMTLNLADSEEPMERQKLEKPLIFTNTGFYLKETGSQEGIEGSGEISAIIAGKTLTIKANGQGSAEQGGLKNGQLDMRLTKP